MDYGLRMRLAGRFLALALSMGVAIPLAALGGLSVHAAPAQSGPYVRDMTDLGGGTGTVTGIATLNDDSIFVASSLANGTGVLDTMDNPGDNVAPDDDSLTFPSGVLGVAANQVDDTAYFVTNSSSVPAGVTWTTRTSAADNTWNSVAWGNGMFVAVAGSGAGNRVMTSPDGITWTARTSAANNSWNSVTWGGRAGEETFVAVAIIGTGPGNHVMTSPDGITWTLRSSAADNFWSSVTWGGPASEETFVAVAISGTGNRVMTSATVSAPAGGRATLRTYARGALDDSAPMPGTGVGGAWADIAVNNADDTVYVASQDDTRIYAFRGNNLDDSRSIPLPVGTTPYALAVDQSDDTVYVLSQGIGFTCYLTAMRGTNPDDSVTVSINMSAGQHSLAIHPTDDTVYVGGYITYGQIRQFTPALLPGSVANVALFAGVTGLAVSDDGRRIYATAGNGRAYLYNTSGFDDAEVQLDDTPGALAVDDYGWVWTAGPSTAAASRSVTQIGTAPTFDSITPTSGLTSGGYTATITGSWFTPTTTAAFGDEANVATTVGTPSSNSMTVTVPPGPAGSADLILTNVAGPSQPLGIDDAGSFTYIDPPPPPIAPSAPRGVTATAGDASATLTWTAPADPGSFPVSTYRVTSSPGGQTCLTATLTCTVTGLTNGTTYTFTVQALNGAGWSAPSDPSNAVTPRAAPKPTITIVGSRSADGTRIEVRGTTTDLAGHDARPWFRFPGQTTFTQGFAVITITDDGTFTWTRKTSKKTYVYVTHDTVKSNTVVIAAK